MLVMDEASQVPVAEAAIPLSFVHSAQGRVVLAGDSARNPPPTRCVRSSWA